MSGPSHFASAVRSLQVSERTLGLPMGKVHWKSLGLKDSGEAAKRGGHKSGLFLLAKCRDDFGRSEHVHQYS